MFSMALGQLALNSGVANRFFKNINADSYQNDYTLGTTLRVLLKDRLPEHTSFYADFRLIKARSRMNDCTPLELVRNLAGMTCYENSLNLMYINDGLGTKADDIYERLRVNYARVIKEETFANLKELPDLSKYCETKGIKASFFINEVSHYVCIILSNANLKKHHFIQSLLPRCFPWWFDAKPVTEDELKILQSLQKTSSTEYVRLIEEYTAKIDLRNFMIKNVMGDFEIAGYRMRYNSKLNQLQTIRERIKDNIIQYKILMEEQDETNTLLRGLQIIMNEKSDNHELADYFCSNKSIDPIDTNDNRLTFIVKNYLDNYDPDMYEVLARNPNSHLFCGYDHEVDIECFKSVENRKMLLDALFSSEATMRIKTCALYTLDLRGYVESVAFYSFPGDCYDMIPNPHLYYYDCLGNHKRYIEERLTEGDLIGAVEQCVASAKSINIGEAPTMSSFLCNFFSSECGDKKCIETDDGKCLTPAEALELIRGGCVNGETDNVE